MREVFKSICGIVILLGVLQVFNSFIEVYVPELRFMSTSLNGIAFVTALMGIVIVLKAGVDSIYSCSRISTFQE